MDDVLVRNGSAMLSAGADDIAIGLGLADDAREELRRAVLTAAVTCMARRGCLDRYNELIKARR